MLNDLLIHHAHTLNRPFNSAGRRPLKAYRLGKAPRDCVRLGGLLLLAFTAIHARSASGPAPAAPGVQDSKPAQEVKPSWTPLQIAFIGPLQIFPQNWPVYGLGLNLLSPSWTDQMTGIQLGMVINQVHQRFAGIQIAGAMNNSHYQEYLGPGEFQGKQGYWYRDLGPNRSDVTGLQIAPMMNSGDTVHGIQLSGLYNDGKLTGLRISGMVNTGDLTGVEIAGLGNGLTNAGEGSADQAHGIQIALLQNTANGMRGLQIGLINRCVELTGLQIGLLNRVGDSLWPILHFSFGPKDNPAPPKEPKSGLR